MDAFSHRIDCSLIDCPLKALANLELLFGLALWWLGTVWSKFRDVFPNV